jgi:hypothetical protein
VGVGRVAGVGAGGGVETGAAVGFAVAADTGEGVGSTVGIAEGAGVGASASVTGGGPGVAEATSSGVRRRKYHATTVVTRIAPRTIAMTGTRDRARETDPDRAGARRGGVVGGRDGCSHFSGRDLSTGLLASLPDAEKLSSASSAARSSRVEREAGPEGATWKRRCRCRGGRLLGGQGVAPG